MRPCNPGQVSPTSATLARARMAATDEDLKADALPVTSIPSNGNGSETVAIDEKIKERPGPGEREGRCRFTTCHQNNPLPTCTTALGVAFLWDFPPVNG